MNESDLQKQGRLGGIEMQSRSYGNEALMMLSDIYHEILKIDISTDRYEVLKVTCEEVTGGNVYSCKISEWLKAFVQAELIHPDDVEKYLLFTDIDNLRNAFQKGDNYICCHYRHKIDGEFRWVSMEMVPAPEYSHDNKIIYLYIKDIHDEFVADIEEKDFLTGGLNRKGFLRQVRLFLNAADSGKNYAIVLFNIKGFKGINEFFGTNGGDEFLRRMYRHFKDSALEPIMIARTNGDRFMCLVDQAKLDYDILPALCKTTFSKDNKTIQIYINCGIYLITDPSMQVSTMCDYAKIAITHIVDEYIKSYAVFDNEMRTNYIIQLEIQGRVQHALENEEFEVYYQPIFDAHTGELISAEALVRWNYPKHGLISPGIFIPALEENGQITQVDRFVLGEVRSFHKNRKKAGKRIVPISINLSWMDFYDTRIMDDIFQCLREDKEDIQIRFEVTETSCAIMPDREMNVIAALREAGAEVLLDDFGSGYSSFSTFSAYDFDIIKLDMGFVQKIGTDPKIKSIIHSIIDMSHHMNAKVIAEGVETQNQLDFLNRHDCDFIQGYYFSKPLPKQDFEDALERESGRDVVMIKDKELTLTDLIPVETLQKIQDAFSAMTGMAALTTDKYGVAVTKGSNFTEFCMKHTRQSEIGRSRCEQCDKNGAELAFRNGRSCVYECHAGLMDYAAPIMVNGEIIGCFIGGQVLYEKPDPEKYRRIAEEIQVDAEAYLRALDTVYTLDRKKIDDAAEFLYVTANILSDIAYSKYVKDMSNDLLREKNTQLDFLANFDMLTKLSNRRHIQSYFRQYQQSEKPYCVVLGDIDDFKLVNDTYGHDCGDAVLSRVADVIKNNLPDNGVPCRWGGEEFLILLYGDKSYVVSVMEHIRKLIADTVVSSHGHEIQITMTFGVAFCDERDHSDKLITLADERLYYGKKYGKNRIVDTDMICERQNIE